jgi:hypothetical protein
VARTEGQLWNSIDQVMAGKVDLKEEMNRTYCTTEAIHRLLSAIRGRNERETSVGRGS